jgi:hypothetical protein
MQRQAQRRRTTPPVRPVDVSHLIGFINNEVTVNEYGLTARFPIPSVPREDYLSGSIIWRESANISANAFPAMLTKLNFHFMSHDMPRA